MILVILVILSNNKAMFYVQTFSENLVTIIKKLHHLIIFHEVSHCIKFKKMSI